MKKGLIQISDEVRELLLAENLSAREILMVLRDIESDAIVALVAEDKQIINPVAIVEQKDS